MGKVSLLEPDSELYNTGIVDVFHRYPKMAFPDAARMRQALIFEYGRSMDFAVYVDSKLLGVDDVAGTFTDHSLDVSGVGPVQLRFAIADERSAKRQAGIVLRVDGKVVGKLRRLGG